jgi:cysteine desulfurase/selenocysteine lyase
LERNSTVFQFLFLERQRMNAWRAEWFAMEDAVYLDAAGQGPLPRTAIRAAQQALEWKKFPHRVPQGTYTELPNRVRALAARLIGGQPEEIAITPGASSGLAAVATGLDWKPGDEVLIAQGEFPAQFTTFLPLAAAGKLVVKIVKPAGRFLAASDFIAQIGPRTRLISASLVRYDNGARLDAAQVARACHDAGALLLLDAAQCAGAMPMDVAALGADFVTASGYKWLLGPYGTGFFWARAKLIEQMAVGPFYWQALEDEASFDMLSEGEFHLAAGARRWDAPETASPFNLAALEASLEFLLGAGVDTVWQHNRGLIAAMIERLPRDSCVLASPADPDERGPFACVRARHPEKTPAIFERLRQAGIFVTMRQNTLRISPHLYNSALDIDRLLAVLAL